MEKLTEFSQSQGPVVGIDLGTTNSLVAVVRDGVPVVLRARDGGTLVPSVVSMIDGKPRVGVAAKKQKVRDASHTVFSVKRLLGRGFDDLHDVAAQLPYELVPGDGVAKVKLGDRTYTAVEISAMILTELRLSAEEALGEKVTRAVITVPAYFNDSQRQATRAAGRLAGLQVLRIVNEPTAASLAYGLDRKKEGLIAVYDLGGGTFDVSILRLHDGIFEVLATRGDTQLGGDDLDQAIATKMAAEILERLEVDARASRTLNAGLIEGAEALKIRLSEKESADFVVDLGVSGVFTRRWTRAEFEALARPLLERTRGPCLHALEDAGLRPEDLSDVVLVGGPTRLPVVRAVTREIFGREPDVSMHPDEVVAAGAAIQADILAGHNKDFLLLDVVPLSLGIETYGGLMSTLIPRNTRVPALARESFTTFVDRQTGVDIHVLQGERERVEDNRSLARFKLTGIPPQPAGIPRVEVTFLIDADGILQVSARDLKTGIEQSVEVRPSFGLTDAEIQKMLDDQAAHGAEDLKFKAATEARMDAEPVLRGTIKALESAGKHLTPAERDQIEVSLAALREALQTQDGSRIRDAVYRLDRDTQKLSELVFKQER